MLSTRHSAHYEMRFKKAAALNTKDVIHAVQMQAQGVAMPIRETCDDQCAEFALIDEVKCWDWIPWTVMAMTVCRTTMDGSR